jgi:type I restriction enzyme S subunit
MNECDVDDPSRLQEWLATSGGKPVPRGWRLVRLGEVANHRLGKMLDAGKEKRGHQLPYLRNPNVQWHHFDLSELKEMHFEGNELEQFRIQDQDILICEGGEPGRAAIWSLGNTEIKFQKALHRVRTAPELLNRFLVYQLQADSVSNRLTRYFTGTTIKHFTGQDLDRYLFPLPPLAEQKRIAEILDKADGIRRKRREFCHLLELLLPSLFREMFGDPLTYDQRWSVAKLGDLIAVGPQNGLYRPSTDYGSGTSILRIDSFYDGAIANLSELKRVRIDPETISGYRLVEDDIIINRVNSREYLGKSALVPVLNEPIVYESNMMRFRVNQDRIVPRFLIALMQTAFIKRQILHWTKDAVNQSSINQEDVRKLDVPLPPLDLQQSFARRAARICVVQIDQNNPGAEADNLFNSLVQRAFRAEL